MLKSVDQRFDINSFSFRYQPSPTSFLITSLSRYLVIVQPRNFLLLSQLSTGIRNSHPSENSQRSLELKHGAIGSKIHVYGFGTHDPRQWHSFPLICIPLPHTACHHSSRTLSPIGDDAWRRRRAKALKRPLSH